MNGSDFSNGSNLLLDIAKKNCNEEIDMKEMGDVLSIMNTDSGTMLTATQECVDAKNLVNTVDVEGNLLVAEKEYLLRDEKVKVLREKFGAGNFFDTYYRIFYLDSNLEESFEVVEVSYNNGPFGKRVYKSKFKPIIE